MPLKEVGSGVLEGICDIKDYFEARINAEYDDGTNSLIAEALEHEGAAAWVTRTAIKRNCER